MQMQMEHAQQLALVARRTENHILDLFDRIAETDWQCTQLTLTRGHTHAIHLMRECSEEAKLHEQEQRVSSVFFKI